MSVPAHPSRAFAWTALAGAALTLVVLAISVWLRVHTTADTAGGTRSVLGMSTQEVLRAAHRVAASAVGLVALAAAVLAWRQRPHASERWLALATILAATALLAWVGRLTPGYRLAWVTVANVTGSIALATAFWWLRPAPLGASGGTMAARGAALAALALVLLQSGLGAAASAAELQRLATLGPWHVGAGPVVLAIVVVLVARTHLLSGAARAIVGGMAAAQFATGLRLAAVGEGAAPAAGWVHAILAASIALAVATIALRARRSARTA